MKARIKHVLIKLFLVVVILAFWPYRLIVSPHSRIRIVDDSGRPLTGVLVVRDWRSSENHQGQDESTTDASGVVSFPREVGYMSLLINLNLDYAGRVQP
jgi:hypothetical protein